MSKKDHLISQSIPAHHEGDSQGSENAAHMRVSNVAFGLPTCTKRYLTFGLQIEAFLWRARGG